MHLAMLLLVQCLIFMAYMSEIQADFIKSQNIESQ